MLAVQIYVHGRGRGHATRTLRLVDDLRASGHEPRVFAGRDAVAVLQRHVCTTPIESLPPRPRVSSLRIIAARIRADARRMAAESPDVVVSDGDLPSLCAARLCGVPTVAVGHGLVFLTCARPRGVSWMPWWREAVKAGVSSLGARRLVAVNFMRLAPRHASTVIACGGAIASERRARGGVVVAYFRDGVDARTRAAIEAAAPGALVFAPSGPPGVHEPDGEAFARAFADARAVIASAGSQLITECVVARVPMLAVYRREDDEQRLNAEMLATTGFGRQVPIDALDAAEVRAFLEHAHAARAPEPPCIAASVAVVRACEALAEARR